MSESIGIIFNIQRFSIHDGPGIRTTVFLKGCPLSCFWCHNPEGKRPKPEIQFFANRCIYCSECMRVCPNNLHRVQANEHAYYRERCVACGRCAESCFAGALELTGKQVTVDTVMAEIVRDIPFYRTSGGGVTLSGGEPLMQPAFARAILEHCKVTGIHTAIETSGHCRWEDIEMLLPMTDLIMMDLKHMDAAKHRQVTGVTNDRLLANAERLMATNKPVIFRIPVIPTVNDTAQEIQAIAAFVCYLRQQRMRYNDNAPPPKLELLPFHKLAIDKYRSLGLDDRANSLTPLNKEQIEHLEYVVQSTYHE